MPELDSVGQDVRYAVRTLRRSPGFTLTAVTTLAVGLGLNAAVFTVTSAVLFRGFRGIEANDRIVYIGTQKDGRGCCVSYPDFQDWRAQTQSFDDLGAVADLRITLSDTEGLTESYSATRVSANTFELLGQRPVLGRDFLAADERPGAAAVAILSFRFWERRYGKNPAVVGEVLRLNGVPTTVIGVMAQGFAFPQNQDLWVPLVPTPDLQKRDARGLWFAFGRLAPGVTFDAARTELATVGRRLALAYPVTNRGWVPQPLSFAEFFIDRHAEATYGAMWGAVGFVLLIACANLANLTLARAVERTREVALRLAIGAARWRIVRQLLIESAIVATLGAAGGWFLAKLALETYAATANPPALAWSAELLDYSMDGRVFAYLAGITLGTAMLFGIAPAIRLSRIDVHTTLKDGGVRTSAGPRGKQLSGLVVISEVALAVVLLTGAGAMARSFLNMFRAQIGVDTRSTVTMLLNLPEQRYSLPAEKAEFFERLTRRLERIPGVQSVTTASSNPTAGAPKHSFELADSIGETRDRPTVSALTVGVDYFRTLGANVIAGREFGARNHLGVPAVIVNQRFAEAHWPGEDALGKRLRLFAGEAPLPWLTVVAVAPNILQNDASRTRHVLEPLVYLPFQQNPVGSTWVLMRTAVVPSSVISAVRREVQQTDASLPIWLGPFSLEDWIASMGTYWRTGNNAVLFLSFAGVALLLASVGLYAIVAHSVSRRTHEIGVRIAVGGTGTDILTLIYNEGMRHVIYGLALGIVGSLALVRLLGSALVLVSPADPVSYVVAVGVLLLAASLACVIPALRAMRVDPVVALRDA